MEEQVNQKIVSYITEGTVIKGDVATESALIVDGTVEGNVTSNDDVEIRGNVTGGIKANNVNIAGCDINGDITCTGNLYVDAQSSITGNVKANQIKVSGSVSGQIVSNKTAEFLSTSTIVGDVYAASIAIEHGAKIKGYLDISGEEKEVVVTKPAYEPKPVEVEVVEEVKEEVHEEATIEELVIEETVVENEAPATENSEEDIPLFEEL